MSTTIPSRAAARPTRTRVLAAVTAGALGAATLAAGSLVTSSAASAETAAPAKAVVSVVKDTGLAVDITGSGFDPSLATGTRAPVDGQPAGTYVIFGKFADAWQPSTGAASSVRTGGAQVWATPSGAFGAVLNNDGTFSTSLTLDPENAKFNGVDGNWGIYTYAGGGAKVSDAVPGVPAYETFTPITFNQDFTDFTVQAGVQVSKTAVADGETVTVKGFSFDPGAVKGTTLLPDSPAGAFVLFGRFPDVWRPSEGVGSAARKHDGTSRKWAVLAADMDTITDENHEGATELSPDGTFTTTIKINRSYTGVPETGNFGIYTYAGDIQNEYAPYETYTPITEPVSTPPVTTPPATEKPVVKADAKVSLKLAKKKVKVGKRAKATVKVTTTGPVATGKVLVKKGKKTVATVKLTAKANGKKIFRLPKLKKGKHVLRAQYAGSSTVEDGKSKKVTLRVVKK